MLRREFLASALLAPMVSDDARYYGLKQLALFTDHLEGFQIEEAASMLDQLGVTGPDLTVRPGGLVDPKKVVE